VTVYAVGDNNGQRRCDKRCYDAKPGTHCDCICGGRNHAQGLLEVLRNQTELVFGSREAAAEYMQALQLTMGLEEGR